VQAPRGIERSLGGPMLHRLERAEESAAADVANLWMLGECAAHGGALV